MNSKFDYIKLNKCQVIEKLDNYPAGIIKKRLFLYKGINYLENYSDYYLVDPKIVERKSKTIKVHGNLHNLLIDNMDSWREYPKRSKSIITTTLRKTAQIYGECYIVLPSVDISLALSPASDIWYSFNKSLFKLGLGDYPGSITNLNLVFHEIILKTTGRTDLKSDWPFLLTIFRAIDTDKIPLNELSIRAHSFVQKVKKSHTSTEVYLNDILAPQNNGFTLRNYDDTIDLPYNSEVWTESQCILIKETVSSKILGKF